MLYGICTEFRYEGFGFSEDSCRSMIAVFDAENTGKLGFSEFMHLWLVIQKWRVCNTMIGLTILAYIM